jgi:hypothetical protein
MMMKKPIKGLHPIIGFKTCKIQRQYLWWGLSPYPNTNPFIFHVFLMIHLKHDLKAYSCLIFGLRKTCWGKNGDDFLLENIHEDFVMVK